MTFFDLLVPICCETSRNFYITNTLLMEKEKYLKQFIIVILTLFSIYCIETCIIISDADSKIEHLKDRVKYLEKRLAEYPDDDFSVHEQLTGKWKSDNKHSK